MLVLNCFLVALVETILLRNSNRKGERMPLSKLLNDSEPMVKKQFDPKEGAFEVAEKVLSSCFLNLSPLS
jgi:hypothetical protein